MTKNIKRDHDRQTVTVDTVIITAEEQIAAAWANVHKYHTDTNTRMERQIWSST